MSDHRSIIIVGGGISGINAARNLRNEGYIGRIIVFDRASLIPYDRPPLSKEFMLGDIEEEDLLLMNSSMYETLNIEMKLGVEIRSVDVHNKEVITVHGDRYKWGKLLLATGSTLRTLPVEGNDLRNVFYLKTLDDAKRIKEALPQVKSVVIVGAGFIGGELASTLNKLGVHVTIIERSSIPMATILGKEMGEYFLDLHRKNNVEVITNSSVQSFYGDKKVEGIVTVEGSHIECEAVVVGIGVEPNTFLLQDDLKIERGYVVNAFGETSIPNVYAAGDCVMWPYKEELIHVEHWDHAVNHGKVVSRNMIGNHYEPYERVPYFWSDQYNNRFQYVGHARNWHYTVLRGDKESGQFTYFYLDQKDTVLSALIVNEPKNVLVIRRNIAKQVKMNPEALKDSSISLKKVHVY